MTTELLKNIIQNYLLMLYFATNSIWPLVLVTILVVIVLSTV